MIVTYVMFLLGFIVLMFIFYTVEVQKMIQDTIYKIWEKDKQKMIRRG
ncbi:hypothetical protein IKM_06236 [Bacillus mycoides]|nr:hypothetical protein IKM_06236 [Bacillus mycoides]